MTRAAVEMCWAASPTQEDHHEFWLEIGGSAVSDRVSFPSKGRPLEAVAAVALVKILGIREPVLKGLQGENT